MVFNNSSFCSSFPINTKSPFLSQHHHTFLSHIHNYTNPTILKYLKHKNQLSISDFTKHYSNPTFPLISSFKKTEAEFEEMTIKAAVRVSDGKLMVKDRTILTGVSDNVTETSAVTTGPVNGVFLGVETETEESRHVISLGKLTDVRFMACFRFKLWWMAQKMGENGSEIPLETQFLLVETKDGSHLDDDSNNIIYTIFLPLVEGSFRSCLQGNAINNNVELCLESGDVNTKTSSFSHALFISSGTDPFATIHNAFATVRNHLNSFRLRHEKKLPGIVDYFGWCTWDAFYQEVTQEGVEDGLQSLVGGGTPPKFVIIDDGWQSVAGDDENASSLQRLTGIKENPKFQNKEEPELGIKSIVNIAKEKHGVKFVYVWHAITGYWGGPDWDMFHSLHPAAEYHASARAISGGPVYVSDKPGNHDFDLLKKMVLPDGSVLRARLPGRPTADCLFNDPARDGVSLLKIWNMNAYGGVLGVYNCQGAAWCATERKNAFHQTDSAAITGYVRGRDVHLISEAVVGDGDWNGDCAFYAHHSGELVVLPRNVAMPLTLKVLEHEVFAVAPVKVLGDGHRFAPIGLVNMFNAGGAVKGLEYKDGVVCLDIKGCGKFGAYCSVRPTRCLLEDSVVDFEYESDSGLLSFAIDYLPEEGQGVHHVQIEL
ncbi:galactinol--sucrose galactosyltransferase [Trifolium repens]|nr:galactinol--sucrose galactosyltransferase [Trifolium repens]